MSITSALVDAETLIVAPPSYMRRLIPRRPWTNIGAKMRFMQTNEPKKWTLPQNSLMKRPVAFGYQKYTPAKRPNTEPPKST